MDAPLEAWFCRTSGCEAYAGTWSSFATRHHAHPGFQVTFVDRGHGWVECEGRRSVLSAGQLAIFPPGAMHALGADAATWRFRSLIVPEAAFAGRRVAAGPQASAAAGSAFSQVHEAIRDRGDASGHLADLGRALADDGGSTAPAAAVSPIVARARGHLDAVIDRPVPLTELAGIVGGSPTHLARRFAREVGLPPHAYHIQARIGHARTLLRRGDTPGAAALAAGFSDQSHFTRLFARTVGMTPGGYRRAAASRKNVQDGG